MRTELLNWAYLGEVFFSRMQGIAFDNPKRNGEYRLIRKLRNVIAVALDGGANTGAWSTRLLSDAGSTVKIVCVEPDPWNAAVLRARFEGYSNVSVHEVALGSREGTCSFVPGKGYGSGAGYVSQTNSHTGLPIRMTTVADICERERISRLDIIKLDVEGSEISALLGAEKLFRSLSVGTVQVEYNVTWLREGRRLKDLFEFVNDLRYVLLAASPFGFIYYPKYGEGLDDFRMRNMILSREDHAQLLHPIGPTGRARVEWGGDRSASLPQKLNEGARGNRKSRHTPTDLAMPTRDQRRK